MVLVVTVQNTECVYKKCQHIQVLTKISYLDLIKGSVPHTIHTVVHIR